jgi:uncharacterized protein (TIGR03437 family)
MLRQKTLVLLLLAASFGQAQPSVGRAILFVHGFCDTAISWASLETSVITYVTSLQPSLYSNPVPWTVYYDSNSQTVKAWPNGQDFLSTVPSSTRFFSIDFFDPSSTDFSSINSNSVAEVSILNKADELAHVVQAITTLTLVKDVIVVAHSQGGLDARAYIENLAIPSSPISGGTCTDQNVYACFAEPRTYYTQDIAKLITLDTPHGGVELANWGSWVNLPILECFLGDSLDRRELEESSFVIATLNGGAGDPPSGLTIASIQSYTSPGFSAALGPDGDGVVTFQEQSIQNVVPSWPNYYDVAPPDDFGSFFGFYGSVLNIYPLHLLTIVGTKSSTTNTVEVELDKVLLHGLPAQTTSIAVQAASGVSYTLTGPTSLSGTGPNTFYAVPTGTYTLAYPGGSLQQMLGVDHSTGDSNWNLTFTIPSTAGTGPTILDKLTSNMNGIVNGVCSTPPQIMNFTTASPQVWLYFDVTGTQAGDSAQVNFVRPDGILYTTLNSTVSSPGQNGYQCFSSEIPISGYSAASYPGTWTIQVFWDQASAPLFTLTFTVAAGNSSVAVLDELTSNTTGIANGSCNIPPQVTTFTTASPQVWLYFDVTGAQVGDNAQMNFVRPDGVLYASLNSTVSAPGQNGYQCFSSEIPVSGSSPASYLGTWTIQVFWDQASNPLFTLNFTLSSATGGAAPTISSLSPSSATAGGSAFTLTVDGANFAGSSVVEWNATPLPTTVLSATQLQASVNSSLIASSGTASISVSSGGSLSTPISFAINPPNSSLSVVIAGITNGASFAKDASGEVSPVAPGSLVSIFGSYPGAVLASAATIPFPISLGGVSVTFDGTPARLSVVVPTGAFPQINAQVPFEVLSAGQASGTSSVVVTVNGVSSPPQSVSIVAAAPGIFTIPPIGQGNAIFAFVDPADNTAKIAAPVSASASIGYPTAPIPVGQGGLFYATGLGAMTPPVADGSGTCPAANGLCNANAMPSVLVGGVTAQIQFAGQAPGFPGVDQVNIVIPNGAPTGDAVPLQIQTADGTIITTPGATIAVRGGSTQNPAPTPTISSISPTDVATGTFSLTIGGSNFNLSTIQIVVTGPGCPTTASCVVSNKALTSKATDQVVAPITIDNPGTYTIQVQNGAGTTLSNGASLDVEQSGSIQLGLRVMAVAGGANVHNMQLADPPLFEQIGGVHGTVTGGPINGTADGFTGNWWQITWDSEPPNQSGQPGWSAASVLAVAPTAGDVPQPNFSDSSYESSANVFWASGYAPDTTNPPNPQLGNALGNCTWYAFGRLIELGANSSTLNALHGNAGEWASEASGIYPVDSTPAVHSIAQLDSKTGFSLGHVAVVESINSDGTITVTESSYDSSSSSDWNFLWRHRTVVPTWFDHFIHVVTVTAAAPAPSLSGVSPSSYPANYNNQTMLVNGSNFQNGATLTFHDPQGNAYTNKPTTFISSNQLSAPFNNGNTPGTWTVFVTNPDGQVSGTVNFTVP